MRKQLHSMAFGRLGMLVVLLGCATLPTWVFAGAKDYPLKGTVTTLGTSLEAVGTGNGPVNNMIHRTYTVKTPTRIFVLECPYWMNGFHIHSPSECGGDKKIQIGDTIHFRMEKRYAYLQTDKDKEQRLVVVSEGMSDASAPEAANHP